MPEQKKFNKANLKTVYEDVCNSYHKIDDFRAKLLGFLPLASGAGIFLVLNRNFDKQFLTPVGIFGFFVTLGLFFYEIRGIQYCMSLISLGKLLEEELEVDGRFKRRPPKPFPSSINEILAARTIYSTVLAAWIFIALIFIDPKNASVIVAVTAAASVFLIFFLVAPKLLHKRE